MTISDKKMQDATTKATGSYRLTYWPKSGDWVIRTDKATATMLRLAEEWVPPALDRIQAVRDLHRPIQVLGDCEADNPDKCPGTHDNDYFFTLCSLEFHGWACSHCCYDDGHPREDCPHDWDHSDVQEHAACPTTKALNGDQE